jgi:shikimate dehydrogenase
MPDRYAVVGNPIAHSRSPQIHEAFARASHQDMSYERLLAPLDAFVPTVERFAREGGRGCNVTVPFKLEALAFADAASERARAAGAANTLRRDGATWYADNTDGAGIVRDLSANLHVELAGRDVLVLGAGGAARGILLPVLAQRVRSLVVSNRTEARADALAREFAPRGPVAAIAPGALSGRRFDVVINATSAGLKGDTGWLWPGTLFNPGAFAYDMTYGDGSTLFIRWSREHGVARAADGVGMLIEQAAESFFVWRGVRPDTRAVFDLLRPR